MCSYQAPGVRSASGRYVRVPSPGRERPGSSRSSIVLNPRTVLIIPAHQPPPPPPPTPPPENPPLVPDDPDDDGVAAEIDSVATVEKLSTL